jgi:hypothetical protein
MITVSVKKLVEAIRESDAFALPDMSDGVSYLYDAVYHRLSAGNDVRLSELDFGAFEPSDVDSLSELHENVFERNHNAAGRIAGTLRATVPASKAVAYV